MKNIVVFGASNSQQSINQQLAVYAATLLEGINVIELHLSDFEPPIYSVDKENANGIPEVVKLFDEELSKADGFIISLAEHNGAYSAAFKNLFDWTSRIDTKVWKGKPILLLATSPGARGGASVLKIASERFPYHGAQIVALFSLPSFNDHFKEGKVVNESYQQQLMNCVAEFAKVI